MLRSIRNQLFGEKSALIDQTMSKYGRIIQVCRLCRDDIRQELALRMLECLDVYDASLCPNLDAYLMKQLRYALLHQTAPSKRYGIPNAPKTMDFHVLSLEDNRLEVSYAENPDEYIIVRDELNRLPSAQQSVIRRLLFGDRILWNNRSLRSARLRLRGKVKENNNQKKERDDNAKAAV